MKTTRRDFLIQSTLLTASAVGSGCQQGAGPVFVRRSIRPVVQRLAGVPTTDGAGVRLTRIIGQTALRRLDPFLMLDRFHSDDPGAYIRGFPDHPHRGFETVTVMRAGRMRHADSQGNRGVIGGGGAQWMTAARGIIHSEMPEQERGLMSGFQLWVNLPAKQKMGTPAYQDLRPEQLAQGTAAGKARLQVISGEVDGLRGPVRPRPTEPLLLTAILEDDTPYELPTPAGHSAFVFVTEGEALLGAESAPTPIPQGQLAILGAGTRVRVRAPSMRTELLIAAAKPLGEPIVQRGPFVMNTEEEIQRAFHDYRAGVLDRGP